jgi:hypothetical protein
MFHAKDSALMESKSRNDPAFDSDICLCYGEPKTQWDRCVLDSDDRGWTLWSTPDHQKGCDSAGIFAVQGVVKGVDGQTPVEAVAVPNSLACQVEVKGRIQTDPLAYAVFDPKSSNCYLKTDDPKQNPFGDCIVSVNAGESQLISQESSLDDLKAKWSDLPCPEVKSISYYGQLPDYYLRANGVTFPQMSRIPTGADCAKACADMKVMDGLQNPVYARPAFTWDEGTCTCYDFPGADARAQDVWRCAYYTGDRPEAKQLFVRTEPWLCPYNDSKKLPPVLENCDHDGSTHTFFLGHNAPPNTCALHAPQNSYVCNKIYDGSDDDGDYYCAYSDKHWTPLLGNAMNCSQKGPDPEVCVDNKAVACGPPPKFGEIHDIYRCTTDRGMQGSPCDDHAPCAPGLECLWYPQFGDSDPHKCRLCQFPV